MMLVVADIACQYFGGAQYDDLLRLRTTTVRARGARIEHRYEVFREYELLVEGRSTIACVNRQGRVTRLPPYLVLHDSSGDMELPAAGEP
jgi:acyl-CoA thioester hydrolase